MHIDDAKKLLRERGLRATAPRVAVLQLLSGSERPLSYTEVVEQMRDRTWDPATMYRNLVKLREAELAVVVSRADGIDRYAFVEASDGAESHADHAHFICDTCGVVSCLPATVVAPENVSQSWAASLSQANVQLRGACPSCL